MRLEDPRDSDKRYFRSSDRLISQNGSWYFLTREGEQGPYSSREAAQDALEFFTCEKNDLYSFQKSRERFNAEYRGIQVPHVR